MTSLVSVLARALLLSYCVAIELEGYRSGRGTYYGNEWQLWDIHQGSCGYGYLCPEEGTGWDIAAVADTHSGSCGQCYEVQCNPANLQDTQWKQEVCRDPDSSIIVTVTDTYSCNYCQNLYSNARWCSNATEYLHLSIWAFEKLAEIRWGMIELSFRKVTCDHKPYKVAPEPDKPFGPTPIIEATTCPKGNFKLKENWKLLSMVYRKRLENSGMPSLMNTPPRSTNSHNAKIIEGDARNYAISEDASDLFESDWQIYTQNSDGDTQKQAVSEDFSDLSESGWLIYTQKGDDFMDAENKSAPLPSYV